MLTPLIWMKNITVPYSIENSASLSKRISFWFNQIKISSNNNAEHFLLLELSAFIYNILDGDEMGWTFSTDGGDDKCIQNFGQETSYVKMDVRERGYKDMGWFNRLRTGSNDFLSTWWWTFRFHKNQEFLHHLDYQQFKNHQLLRTIFSMAFFVLNP